MNRVEIRPACLAHASFITANMREADRREILCQVGDDVKTHEIAGMMLHSGDAFIAYHDGMPAIFFGAHALNICTLEAWAIGTARTWRCLHAVSRYVITEYAPLALAQGFHTMECRSHVDHVQAHRWLESTGAVVNGTPFVYGKNEEKFVIYRWDKASLTAAAERYKVQPNVLA